MKNFLIGGTIIDDTSSAWAFEDVTPSQVRAFLAKLEEKEEVTFEISSPGGSVTAGIAIANMIREASKKGHPCKCHVIGIAASMASVIACACDSIEIDESAFFMIHNPWTVAQGDAEELRKSADVLDQMKSAILSFYRSKFEKTDEELCALMDEETWITGATAEDFGFKAEVIKTEEPLKAAACAREIPGFGKIPEKAAGLLVLGQHEEEMVEITAEPVAEPANTNEPEPANEPPAEPAPAEPAPEPAKDEFTVRLAAAMKSRDTEINELKALLAERTKKAVDMLADRERDFNAQLKAKDEELTTAKAEITRLAEGLESAKRELSETASALQVKTDSLAALNAAVNTPAVLKATNRVNARVYMATLPGTQRAKFYREHAKAVDNNEIIEL